MESDQTNPSSSDEHHIKAKEFKNNGNVKFSNKNFKGAIIDYKKGLLHEPDNSDLHTNLSAAYIHLEKYLDAEEHAIYAIKLKPTFYKGYLRAAKAAHGRGMTTLALKRLNKGLSLVTDESGIRELKKLKAQYTGYLSLKSNAEREMDFSSDRYLSEDEDELFSDDEDDFDKKMSQLVSSQENQHENDCEEDKLPTKKKARKEKDETKLDISSEVQSSKSSAKVNESSNKKDRKTPAKEGFQSEKHESNKPTKRELKVDSAEAGDHKSVGNDLPSDKKDDSQEKKPDRFLELCKELTNDPNLSKNVEEFKELIKTGSEAYLSGNFRKAAESYKAAKERVGIKLSDYNIDDRQFHVIKYAHSAALINLGTYDDIVKAIQALLDMEVYKFSIPALYIQLACAYWKLNRFKTALEPLEKVQDIIDNLMIFPTFTWPGTSETIQETTPTGLKDAVKELNQICRMPHKPTATCRYDHCSKTSTHILPSEFIYLSDPDFVGFVRMMCEEKCHIEFHVACWKSYKETINGVGKINDKDFLGRRCLTMDCVNSEGDPSLITVIEIIGTDGQAKSVNKLDQKTVVDSKKSKKRKCKLDDREKTAKQKKNKEKKVREVKKPTVVVEEEEDAVERVQPNTDNEKDLTSRIQSLKELRSLSLDKWDPKMPFYGRSDEMEKWVEKCENESGVVQYMDYGSDESIDVKDAKDFLFSYFMEILKAEGPLKQADVEDLWKEVAEDFCNIKVVLPNLKSMCDLLIESTCFCELEDYICLAGQLDSAYETVKNEVVGTVNFLMSGSTKSTSTAAQAQLPDLLDHPKTTATKQFVSPSSSEDESSESEEEYNSDPSESGEEETYEENSDGEEVTQNTEMEGIEKNIDVQKDEELKAPKVQEEDGEKYSLQKMLDEMSRVKNMFMKTSSEEPVTDDKMDDQPNLEIMESAHNDTFETARGSSQNSSGDEMDMTVKDLYDSSDEKTCKDLYDSSGEENKTDGPHNDDINKVQENEETVTSETLNQGDGSADEGGRDATNNMENGTSTETLTDNNECNKASQSEVHTEERHMQTISVETKDTLSQTKESDMFKELNEKVQDLTKQLDGLTSENTRLTNKIAEKDDQMAELGKAHAEIIANSREEREKLVKKMEGFVKQIEDARATENAEWKKKEQKFANEIMKLKEIHLNLVTENQKLHKDMKSLTKQKKDLEAKQKTWEKNQKAKIINSQKAQLFMTKVYWESQVSLLGKRCVEKMSEMHSWFSLLPSGEVEELPSWKDVRQITMQWGDISSKIQQIQTEFQTKYNDLETRLNRGEEVDDIDSLSLPILPDEPSPLPLDKIHKEITDKHTKRINELTQLVANQQLEIGKIKESSQQLQQMMSPFQMTQRMQSPLTPAFGGLAFQYTYPPTLPPQYGSTNIPTLPPNPDVTKISATKPLQADVQTLLKESTAAKSNQDKTSMKGGATGSSLPTANTSAFTNLFANMPSTYMMPPPPLVGVAQNLLKASSSLVEDKNKKPVDHPSSSKLDSSSKAGSSRESTPVPASTPNPTPEKSKKKKKSKTEINKEELEVKAATSALVTEEPSANEDTDTTPWSTITVNKKAPKHNPVLPVAISDSKLKNKKKLLDKLQLKFPTMPLKELDEIVKLVREQNNGSLSGLPFDEIETRVERFISKRHFQKSSTMGLVKFTDAAWGPVKQQETVTWTNFQLEECTICLEPMGNDRTKVDCSHEFHTKCLRKWLKEKSVCPLCNNFTTMPDEFPAL